MKVTTHVSKVEEFKSETGRVTFVRVLFANRLEMTMRPDEAPKVGDYWEIDASPHVEAPLPFGSLGVGR